MFVLSSLQCYRRSCYFLKHDSRKFAAHGLQFCQQTDDATMGRRNWIQVPWHQCSAGLGTGLALLSAWSDRNWAIPRQKPGGGTNQIITAKTL